MHLEASQLCSKDVTGKVKCTTLVESGMYFRQYWNLQKHPNDLPYGRRQRSLGDNTGLNEAQRSCIQDGHSI